MATPRVLILRAPGTNCDAETAFAFEKAGAKADAMHLNRWLENPALTKDYQILCVAGGFSYGDDISAGRIFSVQLRQHLAGAIQEFKAAKKLVLGICNGFQVLIKSGVLFPDEPQLPPLATLTWNTHGRYEARWVNLATSTTKCIVLQGIERLYLPIAHAEGRFCVRDEAALKRLESNGQLALRYTDESGSWNKELSFPENPNGAIANVAGICDETGYVFGLMPHPERHIDHTQHPHWTRLAPRSEGDGLAIFKNAVRFFAG